MATVDLGNQGLTEGDLIDPYIRDYLGNNDTVIIPAGQYRYGGASAFTNNDGWGGWHGSYNNASIVGDGEVRLQRTSPSAHDTSVKWTGGTCEIKNITFLGKGDGNMRWSPDSGCTLRFENVNMREGAVAPGDGIGVHLAGDAKGRTEFINCEINRFPNNGIYAEPGSGHFTYVEGCTFKNNNIDNLRITRGGEVRNSVFICDESPPPYSSGAITGRGYRMPHSGNVDIINCDFSFTYSGSDVPFVAVAGSGTVRDCRFRNDGSNPTAVVESGGWSGSGNHFTGTQGARGVPSSWVACEGSGCDQPRSSPQPPEPADLVEVFADEGVSDLEYTIELSGSAEKTCGNPMFGSKDACASGNDTISGGGGSVTIEGRTGNGYGDAYKFRPKGEWSVETYEANKEGVIIRVNGNEMSPDGLVAWPDDPNEPCMYNGEKRTAYNYCGDSPDMFEQWQNCEITTKQFSEDTPRGDGTASLTLGDCTQPCTYQDKDRMEYNYCGSEEELFQKWANCEITTEEFANQTPQGEGTAALTTGSCVGGSISRGSAVGVAALAAAAYIYWRNRK